MTTQPVELHVISDSTGETATRLVHALEAQCRRLTETRRFGAAVQAGLAAVAGEPLRESAHRTLIHAHLAEGNPGEAVRQYHLYRRLLAGELAIEPSAAIRELVRPLLR